MTFSRNAFRRILSPIVLAAVAGTAAVAWQAPAAAQKKNAKEQAAPKANYSKAFVAAYKPVETQVNAGDHAGAKAAIPALVAASETPDDKVAAGRMIFAIGQKTTDYPIALQGIEMVLASGKADASTQGQFAFVGAQIAYNQKDYAKSRTLYQAAIDAGYTQNDPQLGLADAYFAEQKYAEGLKYLSDAVAARKAAGQPVSEAWIKRALATAYNNKLNAEARQWGLMYARDYPSATSWGDAIAIAINTGQYAPPEMLDLLRLARRTNTLRTKSMILEYVDAADARKLPAEVIAVLDAGKAAKLTDESVQMVKDARASATARLALDRTELPSLQRDAGSAGAKLVTVMAAADTLLSYGKYAEAEALYAKAAAMPGANVAVALTRQGIAQVEQGKYADAQATFAKVQGPRQPIANLWALYAAQKANPAAATTTAATTS
jgi:tetratricopeptide (TPR) repeat protein